ncbi:hypothetical protein MNB_SUP05-5-71 [hydrothermal vent metagenome]|uniref:Integral membrane protein CcmA involved in cell shape determination n=1 Tax=hydrothermal vent metagenome TaxID=652676 RepID=A0A1W1CA55_9ZZZZ
MWDKIKNKKEETEENSIVKIDELRTIDTAKKELKQKPVSVTHSRSMIGKGLIIKGELTGSDDVVVQGKVEGTINLKNNSVVIGENAKVIANIFVKDIKVEGNVKGDIEAVEKVLITEKGKVEGNITAGKVVLNEGCSFKGNISMVEGNQDNKSKK